MTVKDVIVKRCTCWVFQMNIWSTTEDNSGRCTH